MLTNVPTDLLRAFVTVVDLGSYTRAAEALGRTQPAVSLQIRRLEELLRTKLLNTEAKQVRLTDAGVALGPYARQMLRLNDDIVAHFANESLSGWIRVGLPTDFSNGFLLQAITRFAAANPEVRIEVESHLSRDLRQKLAADKLDLMVGVAPSQDEAFLVSSATIAPIWAVAELFRWHPRTPLPRAPPRPLRICRTDAQRPARRAKKLEDDAGRDRCRRDPGGGGGGDRRKRADPGHDGARDAHRPCRRGLSAARPAAHRALLQARAAQPCRPWSGQLADRAGEPRCKCSIVISVAYERIR